MSSCDRCGCLEPNSNCGKCGFRCDVECTYHGPGTSYIKAKKKGHLTAMENLRKETCSSTAKQSNRRMRSAKSQNSRAKTGETEVVLPTWEFTYPEHGEVKSAQAQQVQLVSRVERNEGESVINPSLSSVFLFLTASPFFLSLTE